MTPFLGNYNHYYLRNYIHRHESNCQPALIQGIRGSEPRVYLGSFGISENDGVTGCDY
jgi:hypothetical protein